MLLGIVETGDIWITVELILVISGFKQYGVAYLRMLFFLADVTL